MIRSTVALFAYLLLAGAHSPESRYFSHVRDVSISAPGKQNYVIVDEEIWQHARPDLADVRLYDGTNQVPYDLQEQTPKSQTLERAAKILNLGQLRDHTEFDLEIAGVTEYDHIRLQLDAKDFVATALLFGENSAGHPSRTQLGPATIYDFSREKLGSNFVLQLPRSNFPYVHVQMTPGIRPEQVKSATVFDLQEKPANWTRVGNCDGPVEQGKNTIATCRLPPGAPLDRVQFAISGDQVNFRRNVSVSTGENQIANGEISRVRVNRAGTQVVAEQMSIDVPTPTDKRDFKVTIANGDDPPLKLGAVQPAALERRLYFDPAGRSSLKMYYGDPRLDPPIYDYAKFFQEDPEAVSAQLGPGTNNGEYAGRPDERPWSERHKVVLWAAMLLAIAGLSIVAFRGFSKPTSSP
jgi:hypothetical protein